MRRFRRNLVLLHLSNDWHSGQWSRGYRLQCRLLRWFKCRGYEGLLDWPLEQRTEENLYLTLAERYKGRL